MSSILSALLSIILSLNIYPTVLVVSDLDYENGICVFENSNGIQYRPVDSLECQEVGDVFGAIMWDNNTPADNTDDLIIFACPSKFQIENF